MKVKDWMAAALFAVSLAAAVVAVVLVMGHARTPHHLPTASQLKNLNSCYRNLGNGGC
jgi:hypothetical protein